MHLTEGHIHLGMRYYLKQEGWQLIAGQFPGGSDDELSALNVVDPKLARDNSPDHRRHSKGKLVPDLIAYQNNTLLIVEAKVDYSNSDREKLTYLLTERRQDFLSALEKFAIERGFPFLIPVLKLQLIPVLAFSSVAKAPNVDIGFAHIRVNSIREATILGL